MKNLLIAILGTFLFASSAFAGSIQHIGTGKPAPAVQVTFSRNNGASWQKTEVKPGQTFQVPRDATHLNINNVPRDPKRDYKVKDGNVF